MTEEENPILVCISIGKRVILLYQQERSELKSHQILILKFDC